MAHDLQDISCILPTSQVERVVYRFYELTMEKVSQREENLFHFRDQGAYSHQNHEMTQKEN